MADPARSEHPVGAQDEVERIVSRGPSGAFAVVGIATTIVIAIYLAFYFVVYLPRGAVQ